MLTEEDVPTAYAAIEHMNGINRTGSTDKPISFILLWLAFNGIYNHCCQTDKNNKLGKCIGCNGGSEPKRVKCAIQNLSADKFHEIASMDKFQDLASRIPNTVVNGYDYNTEGTEYRGVLNIHKTRLENSVAVSSINLYALQKYYSKNSTYEYEKMVRDTFAQTIYTIRCNFMHGDKNLKHGNDLKVISAGLSVLVPIVDSFLTVNVDA